MKSGGRSWAILAGLGTVALWSTAPTCVGLLTPHTDYLSLTFWVSVACTLVYGVTLARTPRPVMRVLRGLQPGEWAVLIVIGHLMALYYLAWFYALTHIPRISAAIINYLWPVILIVASYALARRVQVAGGAPRGSMRPREWIFVAAAFFGAVLVVFDPQALSGWHHHGLGHVVALAGALFVGIAFALARHATRFFDRSELDEVKSNTLIYLVAFASGLPLLLILDATSDTPFEFDLDGIWVLLFYSMIVIAGGHLLWLYAITNFRSTALVTTAYLTPILCLFPLHMVLGDPVTALAVFGAILVVVVNVILHSSYRHASTTTQTLVFMLLIGGTRYLIEGRGLAPALSFTDVEIGAAVFAIVVSFTLSRLASRRERQEQFLGRIGLAVDQLLHACDRSKRGQARVRDAADAMLQRIIDYQFARSNTDREELTRRTYEAATTLRRELEASEPTEEQLGLLFKIQEDLDGWLALQGERLGMGERATIWILAVITIMQLVVRDDPTFLGDLIVVGFSTSILFLVLTVRNLDINRPESSFVSIMVTQRVFQRNGLGYYLPRDVLLARDFPMPRKTEAIRYRDVEGNVAWDHDVRPESRFVLGLTRALILSAIVLLVVMFALQRHG